MITPEFWQIPFESALSLQREFICEAEVLDVGRAGPEQTFRSLAMVPFLLAQTPTGTIHGIVEDASSAAVPGAKVRIVNINTNETKELNTDSAGGYVQPFLQPGTYSISAEKEGFRLVRQDNIKLDVGQNRAVNLRVELGAVNQEILVKAAPRRERICHGAGRRE